MPSSFLSECKQKVLSRIKSLLVNKDQVTSSMRYSALADSKCIRAGLVFASGKLEGQLDEVGLTDIATSIELMHSYSLIHDDLPAMDDDGMRRGQPSNHIEFNEATAILAGDALQALAFETIASSKGIINAHKVEAIRMLAVACGHQGMILGQQYDLDAEKNELLDIELIHSLKTARLIQIALTAPYLGNEMHKKTQVLLNNLGGKIGLAFQIMDDVLEVSSDSATLGKSNLSDITNKKMTYVSVYGVEESIQKAEALSNFCIEQIQENFEVDKARELIELMHLMVSRSN
ncbi:polyprenyl synthetase family protein [Gammaproteobacteria bacterium]|nr:polyprenyl synthetase family protein [Gammaproteobacteria bacterium]MDB4242768.1 polyprenyl synthetase family protein [Gammaproteobacteria bacterium]MDC0090090.1 polyprenyl synthetase family protein [Gammaproteobacteria bacterium]